MDLILKILTIIVMVAVVITLVRGLWNMARNGDANFSNKMMRLRVFLQFIAVVLIVIGLYFFKN